MDKIIKIYNTDVQIFFEEKNNVDRFINEVIDQEEYKAAFKAKVIIDIGANIGTFSLWAYPFASIIYAIEPASVNYNNLVKTVQTNNLTKIKPFKLAISAKNETRYLATPNIYSDFTFDFRKGEEQYEHEEVECVRLDKFMEDNQIDYVDVMKIDVEGAEYEILRDDYMYKLKDKIKLIIGEFHNGGEEIKTILQKLGYDVIIHERQFLAKRI